MKFQQSFCAFIVLLIVLLVSPLVAAPAVKAEKCEVKRIESAQSMPILAWYGLSLKESTPERFAELKNAGYTHHFRYYYKSIKNIQQARALLDMAQQADVKLVMTIPAHIPLEKFINGIKDHEALFGYYVKDEPSAEMFDDLAKRVKAIQKLDNEHICYINLFPTYGEDMKCLGVPTYQEYVSTFLKKIPVKILTFDHYPILKEKGKLKVRPDFYRNLEIIRNAALKNSMPFWAFALTTAHWTFPVPDMAQLRLQVYSNLAYGAKGIQHFTYCTPTAKPWQKNFPDFNNGPLDKNGRRTVVYDRVKKMNEETQALAGVFLGSKVVNVAHTGKKIPEATRAYKLKAPFTALRTFGKGAVVSELAQGERRFLVLVNRDIEKPMILKVEYDKAVKMNQIDKAGRILPLEKTTVTCEVAPGDIQIFMWQNECK